jgi:AbrB family looped-hinge helix DNA binding protein
MAKATITSKGQVTIPKKVRDDMGLATGDHIDFVAEGRGAYRLRRVEGRSSVSGICNRMIKPGAHASVEDMERAIRESVQRRFRRAVRRARER